MYQFLNCFGADVRHVIGSPCHFLCIHAFQNPRQCYSTIQPAMRFCASRQLLYLQVNIELIAISLECNYAKASQFRHKIVRNLSILFFLLRRMQVNPAFSVIKKCSHGRSLCYVAFFMGNEIHVIYFLYRCTYQLCPGARVRRFEFRSYFAFLHRLFVQPLTQCVFNCTFCC